MIYEIIIFALQGVTLILSLTSIIQITIINKKLRQTGYMKPISSLLFVSVGLAFTTCNIQQELKQLNVLDHEKPGFIAGILILFTYTGRFIEKTELCFYPLKYLSILMGHIKAGSIFRCCHCINIHQSSVIFYCISLQLIALVIVFGWLDSYQPGIEEYIGQFTAIVTFLTICIVLQFFGIIPLMKVAKIGRQAKGFQISLIISSVIQSILQIIVNGTNMMVVVFKDHPLYEDETYVARNIVSIIMRISTIVVLIMVLIVTKQVRNGLIQAEKSLQNIQNSQ